jgi:hypothetical protein
LLAQSAALFEEKLTEPEQASSSCAKLLEETPGDAEALSRWIASSQRRTAHRSDRGAGHPARFARRAADRDELAFRAARITETELSDVEAAISRYQGSWRRRRARGRA